MAASYTAPLPLTFVRGDDVVVPITFNDAGQLPVNITGWTFRAQIRPKFDPPGGGAVVVYPLVVTPAADRTTGQVTVTLVRATTETLDPAVEYLWDLECTDAGNVRLTRLSGPVTVVADVTR